MKNFAVEFLLSIASVALWLVVLPAAALVSPFLYLFSSRRGPRPRRGRRVTRPELLAIPAIARSH